MCAECARRLARRSGDEERLLRLSLPAAAGVALLLTVLGLVALPFDAWVLRLMVGLVVGVAGGALIRRALAQRAAAAELPERRAVREAVCIVDFTWRDMTLAFADGAMAAHVLEMNPDYLPDEQIEADGSDGAEAPDDKRIL